MTTLYRLLRFITARPILGYRPLWRIGERLNVALLLRFAAWREVRDTVQREEDKP